MSLILIAYLVFLGAKTAAQLSLSWLNRREMLRHKDAVPAKYADHVKWEDYQKSVAYSLENSKFSLLTKPYDVVWELLWVLGLYACIYAWASQWIGLDAGTAGWSATWRESVICVAMIFLMSLTDLPLDLYETFKIEEKHGFNKTTPRLWVFDQLKGWALEFIIGVPVASLLIGFYHLFPDTWWIFAQCAFFVIQLFLMVLYPKLILPLFNKLTPLPEGELKTELVALAEKAGFVADKIEVIDSSKRSGHSNAYFSGFGKWRRIVLFDTLIKQLEPKEICAVLAHEIGHSKKGHITKHLFLSFFLGFLAFGLVAAILRWPAFFEAFGFEYRQNLMIVPAFFLVSEFASLIAFWISPLSAFLSRKHEYEADAYAKQLLGNGEALVSGLRKLNKENLSNLTPHPFYVNFYYSHPTLEQRTKALRSN
ncbi:MAG: M48 family metallopeptidase [Opitutales bacterium]|nr:M48 family metallopeptidase [Opitutales bacterium]